MDDMPIPAIHEFCALRQAVFTSSLLPMNCGSFSAASSRHLRMSVIQPFGVVEFASIEV